MLRDVEQKAEELGPWARESCEKMFDNLLEAVLEKKAEALD